MGGTAQVQIRFRGQGWRNEFTMVSPTGRSITICCNSKWKSMSAELLALIERFHYADGAELKWGVLYPTTVSYKIMAEVKQLSKTS